MRQARWAADYLDGLRARVEIKGAQPSDVPELHRRVERGTRAINRLLADLDGLIQHQVVRAFGRSPDFEDLLQDARLHALEMIRTWRPGRGASVSTWSVMYLPQVLRRRRRAAAELFLRGFESIDVAPEVVEHLADPSPGIDEVVFGASDWFRDELDDLLAALDPNDRTLVETLLDGRGGELLTSERGRARAILAHPSLGLVGVAEATGALDVDGSAVWMDEAKCAGMAVVDFFPQRGQAVSFDAKRACATCPVGRECLAAVVSRTSWPGLWGGTSAKQRRAMRLLADRGEGDNEHGKAA